MSPNCQFRHLFLRFFFVYTIFCSALMQLCLQQLY